jgi:AmiR/NasT family two-component response regulator
LLPIFQIALLLVHYQVSIVALTGFSNTSFNKAIEAGFDNVLIKPLHFENIEPLLNHYLA